MICGGSRERQLAHVEAAVVVRQLRAVHLAPGLATVRLEERAKTNRREDSDGKIQIRVGK